MRDRVPLSEVVDKVEEKPELDSSSTGPDAVEDTTLEEIRDLRFMSALMGFADGSFDGQLEKAVRIYDWVKTQNDPVETLKDLVTRMGNVGPGKPLLSKIAEWVSLQESVENLRKSQEALNV